MKPFTIEEYIQNCKIDNSDDFRFGLETVMESLRPLCYYEITANGGVFEITKWKEDQYEGPPTSQELRDEYIRQQTIIECYKYFNNKQ